MAEADGQAIGRILSIWRYPVKSMAGEELEATEVTERGLLGDRAYALVDDERGKVVSAKNPRLWPNLLNFRAVFLDPPHEAGSPARVRITLPDGTMLATDQADAESRLTAAVGRSVRLARSAPEGATAEGYWPDHDWLPNRDEVFEFPLPPGTFFDGAIVHLITTATFNRLRSLSPDSQFDVRRFRPNFVIDLTEPTEGFVENDWIGHTLQIGDVRLQIDGPCPRCVMTTLSQGNLPKDPNVLRTAVQANEGNIGVYATTTRSGLVRLGDAVALT